LEEKVRKEMKMLEIAAQRPFIRGELRALSADVARAMVRATDRATRMQLEDVTAQIAKILE